MDGESAASPAGVLGDGAVRVVRAQRQRIDRGAGGVELTQHLAMDRVDLGQGHAAARDPGLVRDHGDEAAGGGQAGEGGGAAGQQPDPGRVAQVVALLENDAVAVEQDREPEARGGAGGGRPKVAEDRPQGGAGD